MRNKPTNIIAQEVQKSMETQCDIESFEDFEIEEAEQIKKRLQWLPYPAVAFYGNHFCINAKASQHIKQDRVSIFKAKIRGDYYLCVRGTDDQTGFSIKHGATHSLYAPTIRDGIGLPQSYNITYKKCAYIPNGIAMKIN